MSKVLSRRSRAALVLGAHQADQLAADEVHPFQPLQRQVTPEESGRAGQQDRAHLSTREWQRRRGGQCRGVDELVQREITGVHLGGIAAVHRREGGPLRAGCPLGLDVIGEHLQIGGSAHDDAHWHVDVEDLAQQVGERQRGQRISAQVVEVRLGRQIGGRCAQQCASGPTEGLQHRPVGTAVAQRAQLVGLTVGQLSVELF